jgi:hypothetical protein
MRAFALTLLAALTLVTSLAAGVARGHSDPFGRMVLCTGQGPVMVYLDEEGRPTAPPELCPDGIVALFAAITAVPPAATPCLGRTVPLAPVSAQTGAACSLWIYDRARSPPSAA